MSRSWHCLINSNLKRSSFHSFGNNCNSTHNPARNCCTHFGHNIDTNANCCCTFFFTRIESSKINNKPFVFDTGFYMWE